MSQRPIAKQHAQHAASGLSTPSPDLGPTDSVPGETTWLRATAARSEWLHEFSQLPALTELLLKRTPPLRAKLQDRARHICDTPQGGALARRAIGLSAVFLPHALAGTREAQRAAREQGDSLWQWRPGKKNQAKKLSTATEAFPQTSRNTSGFSPEVQRVFARRMRMAFESGGPAYVKFGQMLGSAEGLLPTEFVREFSHCHDTVRPVASRSVRREITQRLGTIDTIFSRFDETPIAAASIAQVHTARLLDGREVVVKVQRPGIRPVIERDIAVLHWAAEMAGKTGPAEILNLSAIVELFARTVLEELDFRLETDNMLSFGLALEAQDCRTIVTPRPIPGYVTPTVLVMERLQGRHVKDLDTDDEASRKDSEELVRIGTRTVLQTALSHGLFHGDLHAGNVMILDDKTYGLLDFGIMGRFDVEKRQALQQWSDATNTGEIQPQLDALQVLGAFPDGLDLTTLSEEFDNMMSTLENTSSLVTEEFLTQAEHMASVLIRSQMRLPPELALFLKNIFHVNGISRRLRPASPHNNADHFFASLEFENPLEDFSLAETSESIPPKKAGNLSRSSENVRE